jgi:hypothetical protein
MGTFVERLMMHFLLLDFLPRQRMRSSGHPAYGAGCGQLLMAHRDVYDAMGDAMGGHATIQSSLHDGLTLPRAFRMAALWTDLCDATDVATWKGRVYTVSANQI